MTTPYLPSSFHCNRDGDFHTPHLLDKELGEVIESAPPLKVREEREIFGGSGLQKSLIKAGWGWLSPFFGDEITGEVILGLDQGIVTMKKGECSLFTVAPSLGYDQVSIGSVPPGSNLQFRWS